MGDASCETRAEALFLKAALAKPGVTYVVCLIGRYSALIDEACAVVGTEELSMPRAAGRQVHRDKFSHRSSKPGKLVRASSERPSLPQCAQHHPNYHDTARNNR